MIPVFILAIENEDDREFMAQLYENSKWILFAELKKMGVNYWDMEDLINDSMVRLIDQVKTLRSLPKKRLINYVITTARNRAKNYFRAKGKATFVSMDDEEGPLNGTVASDEDLEEYVILWDRKNRLKEIWPKLPEEAQRLLECKYILNQKDEEIAKTFGIKKGSVRMKLTRARQEALKLMKELKD